jgi:hypothetical protein
VVLTVRAIDTPHRVALLRAPAKPGRAIMLVAIAHLAGCRQILGLRDLPVEPIDAPTGDGHDDAVDAPPDGPPIDALVCFGTSSEDTVCLTIGPTAPVTLPVAIDTDGATCSPYVLSGPAGCVIAATDITAAGTIVVTGTKPLILVATGTISISGTLDVASHRGGTLGAGHDPPACVAGGLGAGGTFGGMGGTGIAGTTSAPVPPTTLRGGCKGQNGGGNGFGVGGAGGGAVLLIATTLDLGGAINASGAGGVRGGMIDTHGGGGGSGGMIAIDAATITGTGKLVANGGGGASGTGQVLGGHGDDPSLTTPLVRAAGGASGGDGGGVGGRGGAATIGDGENGAAGGLDNLGNQAGDGGGGGAAGVLRFYQATFTTGVMSPS